MKETSSHTLHFVTLFDSNYLTRGLAMYLSMLDVCPDFILYVIAFDDTCYDILLRLNLERIVVISLKDFEDSELLAIKPARTRQEYCWTCSGSSILYILKKFHVDMCTYIDADLIFFENPQAIIDEMGEASVLLTEHRLEEGGDKIKISGIYCVQFMPFKNNQDGLQVLTWWRERCIEWCYARVEDGKMGDQKYLDDWTVRFKGVHVMEHLGGGVAPWNMYRYQIVPAQNKLLVLEKKTGKKDFLIFYHFQSTKIFDVLGHSIAKYWPYDSMLEREAELIYKKYGQYLSSALTRIQTVDRNFHLGFNQTTEYIKFLLIKCKKENGGRIRQLIKSFLQ